MISMWLAQRSGPLFLHLLSRSGRTANASALAELAATSACITSTMADSGTPADVAAALAAITAPRRGAAAPQLAAVLHASGVLQDGLLDKQSAGSMRRVFAPKLGGLRAAADMLAWLPVGAVTLFSSGEPQMPQAHHLPSLPLLIARLLIPPTPAVASLLGAAGQANYAAANAALDTWTHAAQASGTAARSVQWGAWASSGGRAAMQPAAVAVAPQTLDFALPPPRSGMASEAVLKRLHRIGQGSITAEQGLLSLACILRCTAGGAAAAPMPLLAVNAFLWEAYLKSSQPAFFSEFAAAQEQVLEGDTAARRAAARRAAGAAGRAASGPADPQVIREQVQREVAAAIQQVTSASQCGVLPNVVGPEAACWTLALPTCSPGGAGGGQRRGRRRAAHGRWPRLLGLCGVCECAGAEAGHAGAREGRPKLGTPARCAKRQPVVAPPPLLADARHPGV